MTRRIDHLVVAVRDLDGAADFYERLGFRVGTRNRHPWGTENRLVQLAGTFIELITVGERADIPAHAPRAFSFGAFVRDYLARREGLAMLVLGTDDAKADALAFAKTGIGDFEPFFFQRRGRRADGAETEVAFTLAFARDAAAPDAGYFVCQHHRPENFWSPAFQQHANGAEDVSAVVLSAPAPEAHQAFLERFAATDATRPQGHDLSLGLARGRIDVVTADDAAELYGSVEVDPNRTELVAFAIRVPDVRYVAVHLDAGAVPYQHIGSRLVVPASAAHGVAIAFEPE
ncbi:MAG TPA: VOC family protein [Beijerinckiaceae bacterium]|nr:VOC family protein [Beijerinckiaceae bacterium]